MTESTMPQDMQVLERRMRELSQRDLQLWSIGVLVIVVLAMGFLALVAPNLTWARPHVDSAVQFMPQLFFGFISLIVLFNIYILGQRRELNHARQQLLSEIVFNQRAQSDALIDPLTQIFTRRFMDHVIPGEVHRCSKSGKAFSVLLVDVGDLRECNAKFGQLAGDQLLVGCANVLAKVFQGPNTVLRYGGDEFLVVLPDCGQAEVEEHVQQMLIDVECWNQSAPRQFRLSVAFGFATFTPGLDVKEVLRTAEVNLAACKHNQQQKRKRGRGLEPECVLIGLDSGVRRTLQPILESLGITAEHHSSERDAFERLSRHRFDAAVVPCTCHRGDCAAGRIRMLPGGGRVMVISVIDASRGMEARCRQGGSIALYEPLDPALTARSLRVAYGLMAADRLRYFRFPAEFAVQVQSGSSTVVMKATNVSDGGMAVGDAPTRLTQPVLLRFTLPGRTQALDVRAEMIWRQQDGRAGFKFLEMSPQSRREMDAWLAEQAEVRNTVSVVSIAPGSGPAAVQSACAS